MLKFSEFAGKVNHLNDTLNKFRFCGYSEEEWENKEIVDDLRRLRIIDLMREVKIDDDNIDYDDCDMCEDEYYEFVEFFDEVIRKCENFVSD